MNGIPDIFKDSFCQKQLDSQGYVVVDILNPDEIRQLTEIFHELHPALKNDQFISDSYSNDAAYKKMASERVTRFFLPHFERLFINYAPFGSSFLYKTKGQNSELSIHQDWTILDETQSLALNIWTPLCDVNEENGTLMVIPGSHQEILPIRCPTLPFFFSGQEDVLLPYLVPMNVKAGQSVVLNQRLIHYSPPNKTDKIRIAITSGVKTRAAQMVFHYANPDRPGILEVYEQEDDFLISFENFYEDIAGRPKLGKRIQDKEYTLPKPDKAALKELLNSMYVQAGLPPLKKETGQRVSPIERIWHKFTNIIR